MAHVRRWREKILENIPRRFTELGFARMHSLNPSFTTVIGGLRMLWIGFAPRSSDLRSSDFLNRPLPNRADPKLLDLLAGESNAALLWLPFLDPRGARRVCSTYFCKKSSQPAPLANASFR